MTLPAARITVVRARIAGAYGWLSLTKQCRSIRNPGEESKKTKLPLLVKRQARTGSLAARFNVRLFTAVVQEHFVGIGTCVS